MGHIQRRGDGRWRARYRSPLAARSDLGRSAAESTPSAERFLTGIEHSKLMGNYVDPSASRITFRLFAEDWRQQQIHRPGTATSVDQQLRLHVHPVIGDRALGIIRPSDIQSLMRRLATDLAPSTVHVIHGRVAAVFRALFATGSSDSRRVSTSGFLGDPALPSRSSRRIRPSPSRTHCPRGTGQSPRSALD